MSLIDNNNIGETYLVGSENPRRNLEVVQRICRVVDAELGRAPGTSVKLVRHVTDRPGHDWRYALDPTFLRTNVGWRPREDFETVLPALVRWYLLHKDWINSITTGAYRQYSEAMMESLAILTSRRCIGECLGRITERALRCSQSILTRVAAKARPIQSLVE